MTIRNLAHLLLTSPDLDKDVKIFYRDTFGMDITSIRFDENGVFAISVSGYNEDKVTVKTEIEVKSPYSDKPLIF